MLKEKLQELISELETDAKNEYKLADDFSIQRSRSTIHREKGNSIMSCVIKLKLLINNTQEDDLK